jgi:hypothetical protein
MDTHFWRLLLLFALILRLNLIATIEFSLVITNRVFACWLEKKFAVIIAGKPIVFAHCHFLDWNWHFKAEFMGTTLCVEKAKLLCLILLVFFPI